MALEKVVSKKRPLWMRVVALLCVLFTAWHVFATFLWIAPANGLREVVPGNTLTNYMSPVFGQSWSVFAPDPINGNVTMRVRAVIEAENGEQVTEWVDATAAELDMAHHNLFPPRAAIMGLQQASNYKKHFDKLNQEQQRIVALSYFKGDDWFDRLRSGLTSKKAAAVSKKTTEAFLRQEKSTAAYATQVAMAVWGTEVTRVQYEISRQRIIPFAERNNPDAKPPPVKKLASGWRGTLSFPGQNQSAFEDVFSHLKGVK